MRATKDSSAIFSRVFPKPVAEYLEIKRVNAGLSKPGEEDAATLETGKNLCALSQAYAASGSQGS
jgi:hypothetical protein